MPLGVHCPAVAVILVEVDRFQVRADDERRPRLDGAGVVNGLGEEAAGPRQVGHGHDRTSWYQCEGRQLWWLGIALRNGLPSPGSPRTWTTCATSSGAASSWTRSQSRRLPPPHHRPDCLNEQKASLFRPRQPSRNLSGR